ncbi:hypothetical protein DFQ30_008389 [Apophysomyces sp. BC1015]|nr:hypothetical protein DFQ30_008389 [Apophysomyces sp. BC1015]
MAAALAEQQSQDSIGDRAAIQAEHGAAAPCSAPLPRGRTGRYQLPAMDDLAMTPLTDSARRDLLELLDDRHGKRSTIVTSQIPVADWHAALGDPTLADAILNRLVHNAHRITLDGESMRKPENTLTLPPDSE